MSVAGRPALARDGAELGEQPRPLLERGAAPPRPRPRGISPRLRGVAAHDDLAVRRTLGGEAPGVRGLAILATVDDEDEARPRVEAGDQRADAEARVHPASRAASGGVVSAAHRWSSILRAGTSPCDKMATAPRVPVPEVFDMSVDLE